VNYRHAYHAGNFADVVKHAILALVITHLKKKPAPFRVIDTHAGAGIYDLRAEAADKTGEWRSGIGRLIGPEAEPIPAEPAEILKPYLDVVRAMNPPGRLGRYPGSPRLARALMRAGDQLVANELHPEDSAALRALFARDPGTKVLGLDGWLALKSLLPPKERRGAILIDPPFEEPDEFDYLARMFIAAHRKWPTGVYMLWFPSKDPDQAARFTAELASAGVRKLARITLDVARSDGLSAAGLVLCNAPYTLAQEWAGALPWLAAVLAQGEGATAKIERMSPD
jgi:23S rRNA (adenine2030-N6)-methyltransferase